MPLSPFTKKLISALSLHSAKRPSTSRSSSMAISKSDREYFASNVNTETHLLDTTSEQNALVLAVLNQDYRIHKIVTLLEDPNIDTLISPISVKFMIDFEIRTGIPLSYEVIDKRGATLLKTNDVRSLFPSYNPKPVPLQGISEIPGKNIPVRKPSSNQALFSGIKTRAKSE